MATKLLKKIQEQLLKDEKSSVLYNTDEFKEAVNKSKTVSSLVTNLSPYFYSNIQLYKTIINILDKL